MIYRVALFFVLLLLLLASYSGRDPHEPCIFFPFINFSAQFTICVPFFLGTALHYACNYKWSDVAALLIDHGASLTKKSAELQYVALHLGELSC